VSGSEWGRTARLSLHRWTETHFQHLYEFVAQAEIVKYIGDGKPWSRRKTRAKHRSALAHWDQHGFGWLGIHDTAGTCVGVISLVRQENQPYTVEIGYLLAAEAWGQGLASEAVAAAIDRVFHSGHAERVIARYREGNQASRRLLEKLGFTTARTSGVRRVAVLEISGYEPPRPAPRK
jgi:RimJ/RimL family protein N-acetyltransferase